jgi:hypothetical protein
MTFGPTYAQIMHSEDAGSEIQVWDSFIVRGGAGSLAGAIDGASVEFNPEPQTVTFVGTPAFSTGLLSASVTGVVYLGRGTVFSGPIGGVSYNVTTNGVIFTDGIGCSMIPGLPGYAATGGQCQ